MEVFIIKKEIKLMYLKILKWLGINDSFLGYIAGADKLPPPLEERDELELLKKLKYNDKEAKNILVEKNLRLVVYIAKKFENSGVNIEDLISIGTIGLMKAINSYDLDKNIKLATYASRCIENEILMLIRANKKHKDIISLNTLLSPKVDSDDMELTNVIASESEEDVFHLIETGCMMQDVEKAMKACLSPMEQEIIKYRYGICGYDVKTQKEVAEIFNISRSYISRIESKVIKILQKNLIKDEDENQKIEEKIEKN